MKEMTVQEAAAKWEVSERLVRRYCGKDRIPGLMQEEGVWMIPAQALKPEQKKKEAPQLPRLLKTLIKQRDTGRYSGLYDYLQINMVYSSSRMASNRLTRSQVEMLYHADKILTNGEAIKVNDIIEVRNHFLCVNLILTEAMKPLTQTLVNQLQARLLSEGCRHRRHAAMPLGFRRTAAPAKYGKTPPPEEISGALNRLFREYEAQKEIGFHEILDLHVKFERIRPFEDCNGRIGRLLMLKECLRHEVMPFILDDKRRGGYLEGIRSWPAERGVLMDVCMEAQMRFEAQLALQGLLERHAKRLKA